MVGASRSVANLAPDPQLESPHGNHTRTMSTQLLSNATARLQGGELDAAEALLRRLLDAEPQHPQGLHLLGVVACRRGKPAEGRPLLEKALALSPDDVLIRNNLGHACAEVGLVEDAAALLEAALAARPELSGAKRVLAELHAEITRKQEATRAHQQGDVATARRQYEDILGRRPQYAEVLNNLGVLMLQMGDPAAAARHTRAAIAAKPGLADAHANLGAALRHLGRIEQAITAYRHALALNPAMSEAHYNLGHALVAAQRLEEAVEAYAAALAVDPAHGGARVGIAHQRRHLCDWRDHESERADVLKLVQAGSKDVSPFDVMIASDDAFTQALAARRMSQRMGAGVEPLPPRSPERRERIRIGYLSSDFRRHPVTWLLSDLLERHDRSRFSVHAYSHGVDDGSAERQRVIAAVDAFRDIAALPMQEAAQRIRDDGIDILVDLNGHTLGCRLGILARRPTPVQVAWLGYPGAMCADYIDYVLGDAFVTPEEHQPFYDERIVRLPGCFQACEPLPAEPIKPLERTACDLPATGLVFCAFNNPYKITPELFSVWMRLLRAVPGSVLWLVENLPAVRRNLSAEAFARGIAPERLVFSPRTAREEYLSRLAAADIFLDTLPYNAGTTANDALRAGLPIVSCAGGSFAARMAGSLLQAVGLPELVCHSLGDYEALALALAQDPARLAQMRAKLLRVRERSVLFDAEFFRQGVESAYSRMFERFARGERPEAVDVLASDLR